MSDLIKNPSETVHVEIARLANQAWEQAGKPAGRDLEFWLAAEQQLQQPSAAKTAARLPAEKTNTIPKQTTPQKRHRNH